MSLISQLRKEITKRYIGAFDPTIIVMNPNTWDKLVEETMPDKRLGLPVIVTTKPHDEPQQASYEGMSVLRSIDVKEGTFIVR